MRKIEPIRNSQQEVRNGLESLYTLVFCALGVNLSAAGIAQLCKNVSGIWFLIPGIIICASALGFFVYQRLQSVEKKISFQGFVIYNRKKKEIISIPGYTVSERMFNYIHYCGDESIRNTWYNSSIGQATAQIDNNGNLISVERKNTECDNIICELLEYCILKQLTDTLSTHYASFEEKDICVLSNDDIPEALQKNKFVKYLSEKKEKENSTNRKVIQIVEDRTHEGKGKRVIAETIIGESTNMYELFELVLPKKGKIEIQNKKIVLEHPLFSLHIEYKYPSSDINFPRHFKEWYLGMGNDNTDCISVGFNISVNVQFKYNSLFTLKWKRLYTWIDSFIDGMTEFFSQEYFYETIGWKTTSVVIECLKKLPVVQIKEIKEKKREESIENTNSRSEIP